MIKHSLYVALAFGLAAIALLPEAQALDAIVHPYQSLRSSSMGGLRLTTGLYDENFFGNPARASANPLWKFELFNFMAESTKGTIDSVSALTGGGNDLTSKLGSTAGTNLHGRIQTTMPALYLPHVGGGKTSYAFALLTSTQFDVDLRNSFQVEPTAITDIGPAFTASRTFLDNEELAIGVTAHATYRIASKSGFSFVDLIKGTSLSPLKSGGDGAHLDFDVGGTYLLPIHTLPDVDLTAALAINNLMGGGYDNLGLKIANTGKLPPAQPRSLGFGIGAYKAALWKFTDARLGFEFTDIGNNTNGSMFRLLHIGGEAKYGILIPRLGINQGYLCAGLGLSLSALQIEVGTYGEEMSLNVGGLEDRRYGVRIGLQI